MRSLVVMVWIGVGCASTHTPRDYTTSEVVAASSLLGVTALGASVARALHPHAAPPRAPRDTPDTPTTTRAERLTALELIERRDTTVTARFVTGLEVYPGWHGTLSVSYHLTGRLPWVATMALAEVRIDDITITENGELIRFVLDDEHPFALEDVDPWAPGGQLVFALPPR